MKMTFCKTYLGLFTQLYSFNGGFIIGISVKSWSSGYIYSFVSSIMMV